MVREGLGRVSIRALMLSTAGHRLCTPNPALRLCTPNPAPCTLYPNPWLKCMCRAGWLTLNTFDWLFGWLFVWLVILLDDWSTN